MNRRDFVGAILSSALAGGCRLPPWQRERPRLRLGVISDIHVTTPESTDRFRRALACFRDSGVDAVMVAGDLSDWGLRSGLQYMADVWNDVFPGDRAPDGRPVRKLFVTGNHDFDGWWYGDMTLDMHVQGYSEREALSRAGMKPCWEEAFGEPYAEIRAREVNGFTFVSLEWQGSDRPTNDDAAVAWLEAHVSELAGPKPFFFFRHAPLAGTVSTSDGRPGTQRLTDALRKFPNCIAFTGHTHWTLNDERSIWQEEFTAISIPSMSYTSMPTGYENGSAPRNASCESSMEMLPSRIDLREAQGYLVSVFDDRMEVERHDFERMCEAACPWIVPLGANRDRPYARDRHAAATPVPQFPAGAGVRAYVTNATTRNDKWTIFMTLEFPSARCARDGRVFDYVIRAEPVGGGVAAEKKYLSPAFYRMPDEEPAVQRFRFDARDLPERGPYRFRVYARNCFGAEGRPIESRVFESQPGKDKAVAFPQKGA